MPSSKWHLNWQKQYEFVYAALGVHPSEVEGLTEDDMAWISSHAAHEKVAAIGEIGLDYHCRSRNRHFRSSGFADRLTLQRK